MADHVREQIAAAFVTAVTGLTTTGTNVTRDRDTEANPLQADELPGLIVDDDGDGAEIISLGVGRYLNRTMRIRVTAHVKAVSGYKTQLNQILKEVEVAIATTTLTGAKYATLAEVGAREVSEAGDQPTARQAFGFDVFYITAHNAPDVAQ